MDSIVDDLGSVQNYQRERCWEKVPQHDPQNGAAKWGPQNGGKRQGRLTARTK
jgi:hypothetical protein